jgi:hypothetical protein
MSPMQPKWVFYSLRNYYFYILMNCKIYMLFYKSEPTVCWIYLFWLIWVLSSMLNLLMIFWRIEYCMWSVKWIVWLCAAVGRFEYCKWCLINWCCGMFVDLGVIIKCFGALCIDAWLHNLGDSNTWVWDSAICVWDTTTWVRDSVSQVRGSGDLHIHTGIMLYLCVLFSWYVL